MEPDFKNLQFLTEAVIDKRGFMYHGDKMPPEEFVRTVASGEYRNSSSMYGEGLYCVRSLGDALENAVKYGRYIYKIYVRDLDRFLHLDEAAYDSAHGVRDGRSDRDEAEEDFRLPVHYGEDGSEPEYTSFASKDFPMVATNLRWSASDKRDFDANIERGNNEYVDMVKSQLAELGAGAGITEEDIDTMMRWFRESMDTSTEMHLDYARVKVGFSSDGFKPISDIVKKLGIEGVTYTGRQDRRCCLVYNLSNVFPVAWIDMEAKPNGTRRSNPLSLEAGYVSKEDAESQLNPIDYSDPLYAEHRGFIAKYSPIDQKESLYAKEARLLRRRRAPEKLRNRQLAAFLSDNMHRDDPKTVYKTMALLARTYGIGAYDYSHVLLTKGTKGLFDIYDRQSSHGMRCANVGQLFDGISESFRYAKIDPDSPAFPDISSEIESKAKPHPLSFSRNDIDKGDLSELTEHFTSYIYERWIIPMKYIRIYLSVIDNMDEWNKLSYFNVEYPTKQEKNALLSFMRIKLSLSPANIKGLYGDCKLMCAVYRKMLSGAEDIYNDTLQRVKRLPVASKPKGGAVPPS